MPADNTRLIAAHMKAAEAYAELSHAKRNHVGAVIVKENRVISVGYNGMPAGWDNVCEDGLATRPEVLHAESNALMFAARTGTATDGCDLVVTLSPCFECAKLILQSGIKAVYYKEQYRDPSGISFLKQSQIKVEHVK